MSAVILIEDEEAICTSLTALLSRDGILVHQFTSPLDVVKEDKWKQVDAVISDVSMPGMDGIELGLALRKKGFAGPILYITALGSLPVETFRATLEPFVVVRKPFRAKDLVAALKLALGKGGPSSGGPGGEFERILAGDLSEDQPSPVDLFFSSNDPSGSKMVQLARAGELWSANFKLRQAFEDGQPVFARRADWLKYRGK